MITHVAHHESLAACSICACAFISCVSCASAVWLYAHVRSMQPGHVDIAQKRHSHHLAKEQLLQALRATRTAASCVHLQHCSALHVSTVLVCSVVVVEVAQYPFNKRQPFSFIVCVGRRGAAKHSKTPPLLYPRVLLVVCPARAAACQALLLACKCAWLTLSDNLTTIAPVTENFCVATCTATAAAHPTAGVVAYWQYARV